MKKTLRKMLAVLVAAFLSASCGGSGLITGSSDLKVTVDGKESSLAPTSSWAYHTSKSFSSSKDDTFTTSSTTVVVGNFELNTEQAFISLNKQKLEKPEQLKIHFGFSGEKGTNHETPIAAGEYAAKKDTFEPKKLEFLTIYRYVDGKEQQTSLNEKDWSGSLTINGVSGTTINGSLDVTDGKNSVKGSFSANGHKSVK